MFADPISTVPTLWSTTFRNDVRHADLSNSIRIIHISRRRQSVDLVIDRRVKISVSIQNPSCLTFLMAAEVMSMHISLILFNLTDQDTQGRVTSDQMTHRMCNIALPSYLCLGMSMRPHKQNDVEL